MVRNDQCIKKYNVMSSVRRSLCIFLHAHAVIFSERLLSGFYFSVTMTLNDVLKNADFGNTHVMSVLGKTRSKQALDRDCFFLEKNQMCNYKAVN